MPFLPRPRALAPLPLAALGARQFGNSEVVPTQRFARLSERHPEKMNIFDQQNWGFDYLLIDTN